MALILVAGLIFSSCGSDNTPPKVAPISKPDPDPDPDPGPAFALADHPTVRLTVGTKMGLPIRFLATDATEDDAKPDCAIAPQLPQGLSIDSRLCRIEGAPMVGAASIDYIVTAKDGQTAAVQLGVDDIPKYEADFEELFDISKVKTIRIQISESEWNGLLSDFERNPRNENYRQANFYYGDNVQDAEFVANVAFRLRGNTFSRRRPEEGRGLHNPSNSLVRVHFKIKFNERFNEDESVYGSPSQDIPEISTNRGRTFRGVRSLNLKWNAGDPTYLREAYTYETLRRFGLQSVRVAYAHLFIQIGSGAEQDMGVYVMGENLDSSWVRRRYSSNSYLFKCLWQAVSGFADLGEPDRDNSALSGKIGIEITDPETPLLQSPEGFPGYRPSYDLKTQDDEFVLAQNLLNNLMDVVASNPSKAQLESILDVSTLLKVQAVMTYVGKWDGYWRNGNNYYLLWHPDDKRWVFIPYDNDLTFNDNFIIFDAAMNMASASFIDWGSLSQSSGTALMDAVMRHDEYLAEYKYYIRSLAQSQDGLLNPSVATQQMSRMQSVVAGHVNNIDAIDDSSFQPGFRDIRDFLTTRTRVANTEVFDLKTDASP